MCKLPVLFTLYTNNGRSKHSNYCISNCLIQFCLLFCMERTAPVWILRSAKVWKMVSDCWATMTQWLLKTEGASGNLWVISNTQALEFELQMECNVDGFRVDVLLTFYKATREENQLSVGSLSIQLQARLQKRVKAALKVYGRRRVPPSLQGTQYVRKLCSSSQNRS